VGDVTAPAGLFGPDAAAEIEAMCAACPRYHGCAVGTAAWIRPERDVPEWTGGGGHAVCSLRDTPLPARRWHRSDPYPPGARTDRRGLPLGRVGPDGRVEVGTRPTYHGRAAAEAGGA
jgi:hypothetical protein